MKPKMAKNQKIKILVVDDHAIIRQGLRRLIEHEPDFTVCGEAEDGHSALDLISKTKPDLAIIDIGLQGMNGIDLIKNIKTRNPKLLILIISMYDETVYAERALRAGAKGYLMKKESAENVIPAVRKILDGKLYLSQTVSEKILSKMADAKSAPHTSPLDVLSDRELEVFQLIGKGFKTSQIAHQLNLGIKTVESYKEQIKTKLQMEHASELTQYAIQWTHNG
jgi:DNA-binding NarL/FixJ family response regulator